MRNSQQKLSRLKHKLVQEKQKGKEEVIWKLTPEEAEYLKRSFNMEPYRYRLKMNFPPSFNPKTAPGIIKSLYYRYKKNREYRVIKYLRPDQVEICKRYNLAPVEYQYKINLK